jgi:hypothetical protein
VGADFFGAALFVVFLVACFFDAGLDLARLAATGLFAAFFAGAFFDTLAAFFLPEDWAAALFFAVGFAFGFPFGFAFIFAFIFAFSFAFSLLLVFAFPFAFAIANPPVRSSMPLQRVAASI